MKCLSCDTILTDAESVLKYDGSEEYIDLCYTCLKETELSTYIEPMEGEEDNERTPDNI